MSSMNEVIEETFRDAAQRILCHTSSLGDEIAQLKHNNQELERLRQNCLAKQETDEVTITRLQEAVRTSNDNLRTLEDSLSKAETRIENLEAANAALLREIKSANPNANEVQPSTSLSTKLETPEQGRDHELSDERCGRLARKYQRLKDCFETMQARYRKERNIWKQWVEVFEGLDPNLLKSRTLQLSVSPLAELSPNVSAARGHVAPRSTILRDQTTAQLGIVEKGQQSAFESSLREIAIEHTDSDLERHNMPSSAIDTQSIDLDQMTRRRNISRTISRTEELESHADALNPAGRKTRNQSMNDVHRTTESTRSPLHEHNQVKLENTSPDPEATPRRLKRSRSEAHLGTPNHTEDNERPLSSRGLGRYKTGLPTPRLETTDETSCVKDSSSRLMQKYGSHEIVRGSARQALHASDCACCSTFYKLAGPAVTSAAPRWDSQDAVHDQSGVLASSRQQVGRHRSVWRRSPTPPEFWNCDFPTTQEVQAEKEANERRRSRLLGARCPSPEHVVPYLKQE